MDEIESRVKSISSPDATRMAVKRQAHAERITRTTEKDLFQIEMAEVNRKCWLDC